MCLQSVEHGEPANIIHVSCAFSDSTASSVPYSSLQEDERLHEDRSQSVRDGWGYVVCLVAGHVDRRAVIVLGSVFPRCQGRNCTRMVL